MAESKYKKIDYNPNELGSFDKEWHIHKNCKEWWYATGILFIVFLGQSQNLWD